MYVLYIYIENNIVLSQHPFVPQMAHGPSDELIDTYRWARKCVQWHESHSPSPWFRKMDHVPTSTWFSGFGCCEMALHMLNSAKRVLDSRDAFSPSYQFEIASKARGAAGERIPKQCCQYIDILRLLKEDDRKALKELHNTSENPSEDVWNFILGKELERSQTCARHQMRYGYPKNVSSLVK